MAQLPVVTERFVQTSSTVVVEDSREGWARALREIIALLYTGHGGCCCSDAPLVIGSCALACAVVMLSAWKPLLHLLDAGADHPLLCATGYLHPWCEAYP